MFSLEFTRSFKLFLRRFLSFELCFLVFRCSIFKVRFALRSRGQLIQYITSLSFCQEVFQNFFKFFSSSFLPQALLTACRLFDSSSIISLHRSFVKRFFLTFSSFYFLFLHLHGFRDTALSSVHIFYHFLLTLSTLFCLFLPSYPQLRCFAHFLPLFFVLFCMCVFIPVFCRFSTAIFHIYTYTYATLFDYHILGLPMFLMLFLCILLVFGRKRATFFKVKPFTPSFRHRTSRALKSVNQKIFAAQTPQRNRGFIFHTSIYYLVTLYS